MNSPWTVFGIAIAIFFVLLVTGRFSGTVLLGLLVLVILGGIFPPLAIPFGAAILLFILLVHGQEALSKLTPKPKGG